MKKELIAELLQKFEAACYEVKGCALRQAQGDKRRVLL